MKKIIIFLLLALGLVLSYFFLIKPQKNLFLSKTNSESDSNLNSIIDQISQQIQQHQGVISVQKTSGTVWWISDDGQNTLVPTQNSLTIHLAAQSSSPNKDLHRQIWLKIKDILIDNDFTFNSKNSSKNESDDQFFDYIQAYETSQFKCVTTSAVFDGVSYDENINQFSSFTFSCTTNSAYQQAYSQQKPFILAYKTYQNLSDSNVNLAISNIKIKGDTAKAGISERRGGAMVFFYQDEGQWRVVYAGQAVPECQELEEKEIPQKYWSSCMDQNGQIKKGNPNFE